MAYSRVRIFTPNGTPIDELDVATKRSWVLNGVGRCNFDVPIYDALTGGINPKCTLANLQYGNLVLIEHRPSQNADGSFNGLLPPWVGIITTPQTWGYGKVTITVQSAEQVLKYRPMGNLFIAGVPGSIFSQILKFSNAWAIGGPLASSGGDILVGNGVIIQPGSVDLDGVNVPLNLRITALEHIQQYSKATGYDWDITPQVGSDGKLTLVGNWYKRKGIDSGQVISNYNMLATSPLYTEQGEFYNTVYGSNDGTTPQTRSTAIAQDVAGVSANGVFALKQIFPGTGNAAQGAIQELTNAYVSGVQTKVTRTFAPTILDFDNAFSFCNTGNSWRIQNDTVGFFNGGIGVNGSIRISAMEYSDLENTCKLAGALE